MVTIVRLPWPPSCCKDDETTDRRETGQEHCSSRAAPLSAELGRILPSQYISPACRCLIVAYTVRPTIELSRFEAPPLPPLMSRPPNPVWATVSPTPSNLSATSALLPPGRNSVTSPSIFPHGAATWYSPHTTRILVHHLFVAAALNGGSERTSAPRSVRVTPLRVDRH